MDPTVATRRIRGSGHGVLIAVLLPVIALLLTPVTHAEEESEPLPPQGLVDVRGHLGRVESMLAHLREPPPTGGHDGVLATAWRDAFKRRIERMQRRVADLQHTRNWIQDEETRDVLGLVPAKWSPFVRTLTALHTELGTCAKVWRDVRVDPAPALRRWLRAHPRPEPIGRVPSRDALEEVERSIRSLQLQGFIVPASLWEARRRLLELVAEEEERARAEKRREYEEARLAAREAIEQSVAETRRRCDLMVDTLTQMQELLRALAGITQKIEEERLGRMLDALPADEKREADAEKHVAKMQKSRDKALDFGGKPLPRYGAEIQQGWMVPRSKLLKLIEKARAKEAK